MPRPKGPAAGPSAVPSPLPPHSARSRGPIVAVVAAAFLLGVALPAAFIVGLGTNKPIAAGLESTPATTTLTTTATAIVTTTATATVTVTATARVTATVSGTAEPTHRDPDVAATSSPLARPRGTLLVQAGPEGGFGQTFPEGRCAVWRTGFINQSDTAIDQITMAPPGGEYTGEWNGHNSPTRPAAKPAPAVLNVYIAPGQRAAFAYKTCTSTPSPGPRFEYNAVAPEYLSFRWETGQGARACFKC